MTGYTGKGFKQPRRGNSTRYEQVDARYGSTRGSFYKCNRCGWTAPDGIERERRTALLEHKRGHGKAEADE